MILLRWILLPFTVLYGLIIFLRNLMYAKGILQRNTFDFPIICVGNLRAGGTGKTPHIEWLIAHLKHEFSLAVLSRGYGRKTSGYVLADSTSQPAQIGDEPAQIASRYPDIHVAVCESRVFGIPQLLGDAPDTTCILMDDGYQHLALKAGMYILLTDYHNRYTQDWLLPSGRLREFRRGARRADIVVVTKCPETISLSEKERIRNELQLLPSQSLYFSFLEYAPLTDLMGNPVTLPAKSKILAWSGIADPGLFIKELESRFEVLHHFRFADHHHVMEKDLRNALEWLEQANATCIVCTEKDAVKLKHYEWAQSKIVVLPVRVRVENGEQLLSHIRQFITQNSPDK